MSLTVCLSANASGYPRGSGQFWVHLDWVLGLRPLRCEVIWLDAIRPFVPLDKARQNIATVWEHLERHGLDFVAYRLLDRALG